MLEAIIFTIRSVGQALYIFLNVPIKLSDQVQGKVFDVVIFIWSLYMFIKFLKVLFDVSVPSGRGRD